MNKETILDALTLLGKKARAKGIRAEICIFGGTVMMLAYNTREGTKDVDAIFRPKEELEPLIAEVAAELQLDPNWLNDDVQKFVPNSGPASNAAFGQLSQIRGIAFSRPTAKKMLAMKARAARLPRPGFAGDLYDLAFLVKHTKVATIEDIDQLFERFYGEPLDSRQRVVAERALEIAHESDHPKT